MLFAFWVSMRVFLILFSLAALFLYNSLTKMRQIPFDAMNYVEVAQNVVRGHGLVQSAVGHNQTQLELLTPGVPSAFTAQGPLFPLLIAALSRTPERCPDIALLLSALGFGMALWLGHRLAQRLYGSHAGILALGAMLGFSPLVQSGKTALSEGVALALLLACLSVLLQARDAGKERLIVLAGLLGGLCFATRYALLWLLPFGMLALPWRQFWRYSLGFALVALPVVLHNLSQTGHALPPPLPSDQGFLTVLREGLLGLLGNYFVMDRQGAPQALLMVALALVAALKTKTKGPFLPLTPHRLLLFWVLLYTTTLIAQRCRVHFDPLDGRLLLPASLVGLLALVGAGAQLLTPRMQHLVALLGLLLFLGKELRIAQWEALPPPEKSAPRLRWLAEKTSADDWLIGDELVDATLFLQRKRVFSFSAYPYTPHVTAERLRQIAQKAQESRSRAFLVLRLTQEPTEQLLWHFGPLIGPLKQNQRGPSNLILRAALPDYKVYEISP
ncbi:hypothetical protein [Armatimonas sp.]|uniref:ArnT family glycosyltransferase n=1 Tax=Armatimonas sp. TaxID=1872638 RepID=UPI00286A7D2E|nr:hypothetical protein [Armatimonas sp.]